MKSIQASQEEAQPTGGAVLSRRGLLGGALAVAGTGVLSAGEASLAPSTALPGTGVARRLREALSRRLAAADRMFERGLPAQESNGDEARYHERFASFTKGLPHDALGHVDPAAYQLLRTAVDTGAPADFEAVPLAGTRKLVNPQAGLAFDTQGADPHQFKIPAAPRFDSAEEAGEIIELYWMALLRDVAFTDYAGHPLVDQALADLNRLSDFRGPRQSGQVTAQTLFRDNAAGTNIGPYISQFLWLGTPFGVEFVERKMRTLMPDSDHMTHFGDWMTVQRGDVPTAAAYDPVRRYIRNGRDLSEWVHIDVLFQAYFNAGLILLTPPDPANTPTGGGIGCPPDPANPYLYSTNQDAFGTWGPPAFQTLLCEVATRALKAVWYQKWFVHRRLRPEVFAARIHQHRLLNFIYPLHHDIFAADALDVLQSRFGGALLPMAFPEGSPLHPAYGAGHATVAGACVTVLKALFDETFPIQNPVVASADGLVLEPYVGPTLTVGGELDKLASNVATGRNIAGVHWRSDGYWSLRLGEQIAIEVLRDHLATFNEGGHFSFTSFDGEVVVI